METLPLVPLQKIVSYLSVHDLSASSTVNRAWRHQFNQDSVWKPRCMKVPGLAEYLKETPCVVEPAFVSPQNEDNTLTPICHWRLAFMREVHLWNNWRRGKYKEKPIFSHHYNSTDDLLVEFFSEDYIIIFSSYTFSIYDIRKSPIVEVTMGYHYVPLHLLQFHRNDCTNNTFVCTSTVGSCVRVLNFNAHMSTTTMKYMFYFDGYNKCYNTDDMNRHVCRYSDENKPFNGSTIVVTCNNRYFVGIVQGASYRKNSYMHIWDLDEEKKINAEACPLSGFTFYDVCISKMSEDILVVIVGDKLTNADSVQFLFHCYLYNVKELFFIHYEHNSSSMCNCVSYSPYVAISDGVSLRICHSNSSELLTVMPISLKVFSCGTGIKFIRSKFIFLEGLASMFVKSRLASISLQPDTSIMKLDGYRSFAEKIIVMFRLSLCEIRKEIWLNSITGHKKCELDLKLFAINSYLTRAISLDVDDYGTKICSMIYFW